MGVELGGEVFAQDGKRTPRDGRPRCRTFAI